MHPLSDPESESGGHSHFYDMQKGVWDYELAQDSDHDHRFAGFGIKLQTSRSLILHPTNWATDLPLLCHLLEG